MRPERCNRAVTSVKKDYVRNNGDDDQAKSLIFRSLRKCTPFRQQVSNLSKKAFLREGREKSKSLSIKNTVEANRYLEKIPVEATRH